MKLLPRLLAVGALLTAVQTFAADTFEGKVSLAITSDKGKAANLDYSLKGQKIRMDMNAGGSDVATIMDMGKLEMLVLMNEQHMYMVMPMQKPTEQAMEKSGAANGSADVEVTGKTETILGYKCNQILVKDKNSTTEVWAAEGLGAFMGLGGGGPMGGGGGMFGGGKRGGGAAAAKWEEAMKGKGGFPLRVISRDASGKQTFKMEATKIEPGSLPDSQFAPPEGFQKFSMPNMGGMFKPGGE